MLKDVIDFVMSRGGCATREDALREINYAWREIWNSDDLPGSVFEVTVQAPTGVNTISLPWYVGQLRGVKSQYNKERVHLNTPRPWYQDHKYYQTSLVWKIMGIDPLAMSVLNATVMTLSITDAETEQFKVCIEGATDNASKDYEEVVFAPGDLTRNTSKRFTNAKSIIKSILTNSDVTITGANGEELGMIANGEYEAKNTIVQITDPCIFDCSWCRCFDVLYKMPAPILAREMTSVPFEEVIGNKAMEYISLPKVPDDKQAGMFGAKSASLLTNYNNDESSVEHHLDIGTNKFTSRYHGYL